MDLALLKATDKELLIMSIEKSRKGKEVRNEIKRRRAVGYCDGTAIAKVQVEQ